MKATTNILGYDFICEGTYQELAEQIIKDVNGQQAGITNFITPNAHGINMYAKHPYLLPFCRASKYILPDGQPIVWLSRFTPKTIKQRLTGSDFFPVLFKKLQDSQEHCLFVVSRQEVAAMLKKERPFSNYMVPEFFRMDERDKINAVGSAIAELVREKNIKYVFIGISEPKQGALAYDATEKLKEADYNNSCIFFFLGASFEFYLGLKRRAPKFFQKTGLEWMFRLLSEPGRMYKRYIFGNLAFLGKATKWVVKKKLGGKNSGE